MCCVIIILIIIHDGLVVAMVIPEQINNNVFKCHPQERVWFTRLDNDSRNRVIYARYKFLLICNSKFIHKILYYIYSNFFAVTGSQYSF